MEEGIMVREYDEERDRLRAEAMERMCEVGPSGEMSLFTDHFGDPVSRVRRSPAFLMLVAETSGPVKEIVGLIRGSVKSVTCGKAIPRNIGAVTAGKHENPLPSPIYTKVAYILGLRVSPFYRRMGIGLRLVRRLEEWFKVQGAEYAYMATDKDNEASIRLFTGRCGYSKFRTPAILVNPVFAHRLPIPRRIRILRLPVADAESLYRCHFSTTEFFPRDIDAILSNPLSLGTFLAVPVAATCGGGEWKWPGTEGFLAAPLESWAVVSVWNCGGVFRLEVRGASRVRRGLAWATRAADRALPWLRIPSVPDIFRPFGALFLYGIGGEGPEAAAMVAALCRHSHNMGKGTAGVVAAEVAVCEPLRRGIPHWRRLSFAEDLWCAKRLAEGYGDGGAVGDWTKSPPGKSIFVDPREL
ncbi:probable N-acetyltransferase HLS1 [Elaeis guineensis]|uniref:Probable N-acetyltransferase HLS1 n=1 Tax=Elaeis guineensis var. tenera TaxID=51953 RepID=A0A6I9SFE5_ELAGV|nr:probable N-acetyltransferase HLS1 [Elaeis guineensis]